MKLFHKTDVSKKTTLLMQVSSDLLLNKEYVTMYVIERTRMHYLQGKLFYFAPTLDIDIPLPIGLSRDGSIKTE